METSYRHTQITVTTTVVLAISAALAASMLWSSRDPRAVSEPLNLGAQGCIPLYLIAILIAWLIAYRLTIEPDADAIRWRVGVGLLRDSYALTEIRSVSLVAAPFSILPRLRRSGATQFVSVAPGRRGVELALSDGRRVVLGTNAGEALVAAMSAAQGELTGRGLPRTRL